MWTSKILEFKKTFSQGVEVNVCFTNGTETFNELVYVVTLEQLQETVRSRIDVLQKGQELFAQLSAGSFTPPEKEADPTTEAFIELQDKKRLVLLGILDETSPEYQAALEEAKRVYDESK